MMKTFILLSAFLISSITTPVHAMDDAQFSEANARYLAAVNGDKNTVRKAIRYFNKFSVSTPYDSLIQTYRGSLESVMATHVYMPWNKMEHVELGSEWMDDVLDEITEIHDTTQINGTSLSIHIKFNTAHSYFQFPDFLNRYQDSKDLISEILESSQFKNANIRIKNGTYELAAAMAEKDGDKQKQTDFLSKIQSIN